MKERVKIYYVNVLLITEKQISLYVMKGLHNLFLSHLGATMRKWVHLKASEESTILNKNKKAEI